MRTGISKKTRLLKRTNGTIRLSIFFVVLTCLYLPSCMPVSPEITKIQSQLEALSPPWVREHRSTFQNVLEHSLAVDLYQCEPLPEQVFFGPTPSGSRVIEGSVPHYGFFWGPMHYRISRDHERWLVKLRYAVDPPNTGELELPDCRLSEWVPQMQCEGVPYSQSTSVDACPRTGVFRTPLNTESFASLLSLWSRDVEQYYNRDAESLGLPIHYDIDYGPASDCARADICLPLSTTCGRTPYFVSLRSGWSLPILAHEAGHVMGLLDEYEMFSGIVSYYPKTPFLGADRSRMGLSMREQTVLLPLHHYLILRRYFCPEPHSRDPFRGVLEPSR